MAVRHRDGDDAGQIAGTGSEGSLTRAYRLSPCLADLNRDPVIDERDFEPSYRAFDAGDALADVDGDAMDEALFPDGYRNGC